MPYSAPVISNDLLVSQPAWPNDSAVLATSSAAVSFSISSTATSTATSTNTQCHCVADVALA